MVAEEHLHRKRTPKKYIMDRVKSMKDESLFANIAPEQDDVEDLVWANYLHERPKE